MSVAYDIAIPLVRGRHQNRTLAARRRARCVQLAAEGWTYEAIRKELGYANRGTVWRTVHRALDATTHEGVAELRKLQLDRLESLLAAVWHQAAGGDVAAILAATRVLDAEVRLLGLKAEARPCTQPQTVVLMEDDCRSRGCPQHA